MDLNHRPHAYQACALTSWAIGPFPLKRVTRIGLATKAWKAFVLPLNYTRTWYKKWMARDGIEPPTQGASILCSTNWAIEPLRSLPDSDRWSPPWQGGVITPTPRDHIAGTGFEPMTFGLWARRATRLLHPAMFLYKKSQDPMDLVGLEPTTRRLWAVCSNQLS